MGREIDSPVVSLRGPDRDAPPASDRSDEARGAPWRREACPGPRDVESGSTAGRRSTQEQPGPLGETRYVTHGELEALRRELTTMFREHRESVDQSLRLLSDRMDRLGQPPAITMLMCIVGASCLVCLICLAQVAAR